MNTQELKNFVKGIVRENIENKIFREILNEVSPPGKKAERMIQHVKSSLRQSHPNWSEDKITGVAIATAWKSRNKGSVEEAGVDEAGLTSEKKDKWIQKAVDPKHKGYCTPMTKSTCTPRRKALAKRFKKGLEEMGLTLHKKEEENMNEASYKISGTLTISKSKYIQIRNMLREADKQSGVLLRMGSELIDQFPNLDAAIRELEDIIDDVEEEFNSNLFVVGGYSIDEASYKVVSPTQIQVQKDDQARRVQTEPKVNEVNMDEAAYKVQKRSYQTVQDVGQNPENPADPDVPFQP